MSRRFWKPTAWLVLGLAAVVLLAALALTAWGEYRLWRVRREVGGDLADLYPDVQLAQDEVNGSDVLDAASALTSLAVAEAGGDPAGAGDTAAFVQAAHLIRNHADVAQATLGATTPEALRRAPLTRSGGARGLDVIRVLRSKAVETLERGDLDEYLLLVNDQLAVSEWVLLESPLPMSLNLGLAGAARTLAAIGEQWPSLLAHAPIGLQRRLARLSRIEVASAMRAEQAFVLAVSPMPRQGGIAATLARLPGVFVWADSEADQAEAIGALADRLQAPPYQRAEPTDELLAPWAVDALQEMALRMEAYLVQVQVAAAAQRYLQACLENDACGPAPSVRVAERLVAVDPFSGEDWKWFPRGDQCVFYSVGPDGRDDGGSLFARGEITEPGIDIGWILPCGETSPDIEWTESGRSKSGLPAE